MITNISTSQLPNIFEGILTSLFEKHGAAIDGSRTFPCIEVLDVRGWPRKIYLDKYAEEFAGEVCSL
jgi:hypothetical protein